MLVTICNRSLACSTLVFGGFGLHSDITHFAKKFFEACFDAENNEEWTDDDGETRPALDGYEVKDFAFFIASTSSGQSAEEHLAAIGFQKTERVHKNKNPGNECIFWMMPVHKVIDYLKPYDPAGYDLLGTDVQRNGNHTSW